MYDETKVGTVMPFKENRGPVTKTAAVATYMMSPGGNSNGIRNSSSSGRLPVGESYNRPALGIKFNGSGAEYQSKWSISNDNNK